MVDARTSPPVAAAYHLRFSPVAVKSTTVPAWQIAIGAAVGAVVVFIVTATSVRVLSQLPIV